VNVGGLRQAGQRPTARHQSRQSNQIRDRGAVRFSRADSLVDQDCSGKDAPFPELVAAAKFTFRFDALNVVITRIDITRLRGGETATITCTSTRRCCPFKAKTFMRLMKGKRSFGRSLLRGRRLQIGTIVSVRVTKAQTIGTFRSLRVVLKKRPKIKRACLQPGARNPSACP